VGQRAIEPAVLHRQTAGNPFFITEILASAEPGLPPSIRDAVLGRVERLSYSARSLVDAAAVAGPKSAMWLLQAIASAEFESLDECLGGGILRVHEDAISFRHELSRQAVLDAIPAGRRAELHRLALHALEALPAGRADLMRLAHHAEGANDERAIRAYVPTAARHASAAGAHRAAADLLASCLRQASTLSDAELAGLFEAHAMECYHVADMAGAIASWRQAIELCHRDGDPAREGMNLAIFAAALASAGQRDEARRANRAAIDLLLPLARGRELALAYGTQAILHQYDHDLEDAIELAQRAIALAGAAGDSQILVMAYDTLGMSLMFDDYERGRGYLERARDLAREAGLDAAVARAYGDLGAVSVAVFQLEQAERFFGGWVGLYCRPRSGPNAAVHAGLDVGGPAVAGPVGRSRPKRRGGACPSSLKQRTGGRAAHVGAIGGAPW
jgi:tetratricopeptide (TPR) repeat protein